MSRKRTEVSLPLLGEAQSPGADGLRQAYYMEGMYDPEAGGITSNPSCEEIVSVTGSSGDLSYPYLFDYNGETFAITFQPVSKTVTVINLSTKTILSPEKTEDLTRLQSYLEEAEIYQDELKLSTTSTADYVLLVNPAKTLKFGQSQGAKNVIIDENTSPLKIIFSEEGAKYRTAYFNFTLDNSEDLEYFDTYMELTLQSSSIKSYTDIYFNKLVIADRQNNTVTLVNLSDKQVAWSYQVPTAGTLNNIITLKDYIVVTDIDNAYIFDYDGILLYTQGISTAGFKEGYANYLLTYSPTTIYLYQVTATAINEIGSVDVSSYGTIVSSAASRKNDVEKETSPFHVVTYDSVNITNTLISIDYSLNIKTFTVTYSSSGSLAGVQDVCTAYIAFSVDNGKLVYIVDRNTFTQVGSFGKDAGGLGSDVTYISARFPLVDNPTYIIFVYFNTSDVDQHVGMYTIVDDSSVDYAIGLSVRGIQVTPENLLAVINENFEYLIVNPSSGAVNKYGTGVNGVDSLGFGYFDLTQSINSFIISYANNTLKIRRVVKTTLPIESPYKELYANNINDVAYYQGRLLFLTNRHLIATQINVLSRIVPNKYYTYTDADPFILYPVLSDDKLLYIVAFNDQLILFGRDAQYIVAHSGIFSLKNVAVKQTTTYNTAPVRPLRVGDEVYFGVTKADTADYMDVYVMIHKPNTFIKSATKISPQYLNIYKHSLAYYKNRDYLFVGGGYIGKRLRDSNGNSFFYWTRSNLWHVYSNSQNETLYRYGILKYTSYSTSISLLTNLDYNPLKGKHPVNYFTDTSGDTYTHYFKMTVKPFKLHLNNNYKLRYLYLHLFTIDYDVSNLSITVYYIDKSGNSSSLQIEGTSKVRFKDNILRIDLTSFTTLQTEGTLSYPSITISFFSQSESNVTLPDNTGAVIVKGIQWEYEEYPNRRFRD